jgi:hypothetical protein
MMAIWPAIRGVGLRQQGGVSRSRRCRQRSGEWGVGREKWGAVVGTSGGDDSSSKDDVSKGGGAVVEPRSKIPQQPGKPAGKK